RNLTGSITDRRTSANPLQQCVLLFGQDSLTLGHFLVPPKLFTQPGHSLLELPSVVGTDPMAVLLVLERLSLADQGLELRLVLLQAPRTQYTHRVSLSAPVRRAYRGAERPRPS